MLPKKTYSAIRYRQALINRVSRSIGSCALSLHLLIDHSILSVNSNKSSNTILQSPTYVPFSYIWNKFLTTVVVAIRIVSVLISTSIFKAQLI